MALFYFLLMILHLALSAMAFSGGGTWSGFFFSVSATCWAVLFALSLEDGDK